MSACMFKSHSSKALNRLSRTITSRCVPTTTGKPICYTSVSGLSTSLLLPAECSTCSHIRVSLSSALQTSVSSVWGWEPFVTHRALFVNGLGPGKGLKLMVSESLRGKYTEKSKSYNHINKCICFKKFAVQLGV